MKGFSNDKIPDIPIKVITITVNGSGNVFMGKDTLTTDILAAELKERLWKSYLGNGRMYDQIELVLQGEVLMGVKGAALDAIKEAQGKALKELCIEKYKKPFENLSAAQQKKVKRQFPVLFQELHW